MDGVFERYRIKLTGCLCEYSVSEKNADTIGGKEYE
jgi:hypothetical protein